MSARTCIALTIVALATASLTAQFPGTPGAARPGASIRYGGSNGGSPKPTLRYVQGIVRDADGKPVARTQVFIRDENTKAVRVAFTDEQGKYLFGSLPIEHDFTVWAQVAQVKTAVRPISSFIATPDVTINLTVAAAPATSTPPATAAQK